MQKHLVGIMFVIALTIAVLGGQPAVHASSASTHKADVDDNLWDIAQNNNVSVEDLFTWNNSDTALLSPKEEPKIESKSSKYVVQKGDTLSKIARTHGISLEDLMKWNGITNHLIFPGEELSISGFNDKPLAPRAVNNNTQSASEKSSQPAKKSEQQVASQPAGNKNTQNNNSQNNNSAANNQTPASASGKEMTVTATAYTAYCPGCSGTTYTGIDLRANPHLKVIAVDPSIIPLGSRVWVEGYGEAIAGDTGGAIKGNIIDVFIENKQDALNWGRRTVKIKVLN